MLRIGLTGGIGSGKTTVADMFKQLGVTVIDADQIARDITAPNTTALQAIIKHFGRSLLKSDGTLDRSQLRDIIFNNPTERDWLQGLLHPAIRLEMQQQIKVAKPPYCILAIPLLTESSSIDFVDRILVIDAPEALQLERATARDQSNAAAIKAIMQSQSSRAERLAYADDIIVNDSSLDALRQQVVALHKIYLQNS